MPRYQVLFTLLPNGFAADGRARLSLVASPRPAAGRLGDSDVFHWPDIVAGWGPRALVLVSGGEPVEATVTSPRPDAALWAKLFPADTPVSKPTDDLSGLEPVVESAPYAEEVAFIDGLYADALLDPGQAIGRVAGLNAWRGAGADVGDLLDPTRLTRDRLRAAGSLLRGRRQGAAADAVALVPRLRRLALTGATRNNPYPGPPPVADGPLNVIAEPETADFAQVISALLRHPFLASALGLRVDLTMPAFTGTRLIRLGRLDGTVLDGPEPMAQPWSAVSADPGTGRFVMATEADDRTEIVNGMLDLRPDTGDAARYLVSDVDTTAIGQQLDILARRIPDAGPGPLGLPARRSAGLRLAQVDRRARRMAHLLARNAQLIGAAVGDEPVLYADDVTTGYRVDVQSGHGAYRSLMRRTVRYRVGTGAAKAEFAVSDEGSIDAVVPMQQFDSKGRPHVFLGEELFTWKGWGFGGPVPGPVVGAETATAPQVVAVDAAPLPGYPLHVSTEVAEGSLTPLRFGREYGFRIRAVDLAGNSVEAAAVDPTYVTARSTYRRLDAVPAPVLVARRAFRPGESLNQVVAYSDGDGHPDGLPAERHLAAPKTSQHMAELHGAFDAAFGPNATPATRDAMFEVARREEGTFLDPVVPGPGGGQVPADGITVVTPNTLPTMLPVQRGDGLAPGEYIAHDTNNLLLPYLPDVPAAGVALSGLPGLPGPLVVGWTLSRRPWPDRPPVRLVVRPGGVAPATSVQTVDGRRVVVVDLPPATTARVAVSSALYPEGLATMAGPRPGEPGFQQALDGQISLLTPREEITLVHAVRKPLTVPTMSAFTPDVAYPPGRSAVTVTADVAAHVASTASVGLEATWTELVDRGYGPVTTEDRRVTIAAAPFDIDPFDGFLHLAGKHDFGDPKRRVVSIRPVAGSRFAEYFPDAGERDLLREGAPQQVNVISRIRPKPPKVHSVVPIMGVERRVVTGDGGVKRFESTHTCRGVRVYLDRPWCTSGEGELLGVVVAKDQNQGANIAFNSLNTSLRERLTRYGADLMDPRPLNNEPDRFFDPTYFEGWTGIGPTEESVKIPGIGNHSPRFAILGYPVVFDPDRNLWFADVHLKTSGPVFRRPGQMLFLSLVAFQPTSWSADGNPGDLRVSAVVNAEPVKLVPTRTVSARIVDPNLSVRVSVSSHAAPGAEVRLRWQSRRYEPQAWPNPAPELCRDNSNAPEVSVVPVAPNDLTVELTIRPNAGLPAAALTSLRNGRIVVEELRVGWGLSSVGTTRERAVFTEVFDVRDLL